MRSSVLLHDYVDAYLDTKVQCVEEKGFKTCKRVRG